MYVRFFPIRFKILENVFTTIQRQVWFHRTTPYRDACQAGLLASVSSAFLSHSCIPYAFLNGGNSEPSEPLLACLTDFRITSTGNRHFHRGILCQRYFGLKEFISIGRKADMCAKDISGGSYVDNMYKDQLRLAKFKPTAETITPITGGAKVLLFIFKDLGFWVT